MTLLLSVMGGLAAAQTQTPTVLPPVVVQEPLPGYPRGNQGSYGEKHPNKVLVCHATSATNRNAYVLISVSKNARNAHLEHEHQTGNGQDKAQRDTEGSELGCGEQAPS